MAGRLTCWTLCKIDINTKKQDVYAIATTVIIQDTLSVRKYLEIYSLAGVKEITTREWIKVFSDLMVYAKARGCCKITATTRVDRIRRLVKHLGGDTTGTALEMEV